MVQSHNGIHTAVKMGGLQWHCSNNMDESQQSNVKLKKQVLLLKFKYNQNQYILRFPYIYNITKKNKEMVGDGVGLL